jgi:hypothetical protein
MRPKLSAKLATHSIIKPEAISFYDIGRRLTVPNHRELAKGTKQQFAELL